MIRPGDLSNRAHRRPEVERSEEGAVSPADLARQWGVHLHTIYRDINKGALPAFRLPGGRFRIRREDARRYGRPVD